jgi:hypothetical protein
MSLKESSFWNLVNVKHECCTLYHSFDHVLLYLQSIPNVFLGPTLILS